MALIVEPGTGEPDSDSYISLADARTYAENYGLTLPDDDTEADVLLRLAAQDVDTNNFKGQKLNPLQGLDFPRTGVECNGLEVEISKQLLQAGRAQVYYADARASGVVPTGNDNGKEVKLNEVTGAVKQEFFQSYNTSDSVTITQAVNQLDCLIDDLQNSFTLRTVRV